MEVSNRDEHIFTRPELDELNRIVQQVKGEVAKVIVGQQDVINQMLACILAGGHALLEGVPGLGKTLLVRTIAKSLALKFSRIQFTPDLMPADITGTNILSAKDGQQEFRFQPGPVFGNVILADEINRATPKTQSALLEAMQEHTVTVGGETRRLPEPFFVLATQNPLEMEGTYPLPEAQIDRFLMKIMVAFPSVEELKQIATRTTSGPLVEPNVVADGNDVQRLQQVIRQVPIADMVVGKAVDLLIMTHPNRTEAPPLTRQYVRAGAGPRAIQALVATARVRTFLDGRYNVSIDDITAVAFPVLRHRLLLNFEAEASGVNGDQILEELLAIWKQGNP